MHQSPRGSFVDNPAIHRAIRTMLARFAKPSRARMRAKIRADRAAAREHQTEQADAGARHTYREFVVGLYLQRCGFAPEYNHRLDGKTPDWYDERRRLVLEVFTCERGRTEPGPRAAARIAQKVRTYSPTVRERSLCFVVAVHGDELSGLSAEICEQAIAAGRVFCDHPDLSGVLFFAAAADQEHGHAFTYFANPHAARKMEF